MSMEHGREAAGRIFDILAAGGNGGGDYDVANRPVVEGMLYVTEEDPASGEGPYLVTGPFDTLEEAERVRDAFVASRILEALGRAHGDIFAGELKRAVLFGTRAVNFIGP